MHYYELKIKFLIKINRGHAFEKILIFEKLFYTFVYYVKINTFYFCTHGRLFFKKIHKKILFVLFLTKNVNKNKQFFVIQKM